MNLSVRKTHVKQLGQRAPSPADTQINTVISI